MSMSARWRCAVCETVNDGGTACAACGTPRAESVTRAAASRAARPPDLPAAPAPPAPPARERQGRALPEEPAVRPRPGEPQRHAPPDVYDLLGLDRPVNPRDDDYYYYELGGADERPRVRWFGCCLPVVLGALAALLGSVTVLARLLIW